LCDEWAAAQVKAFRLMVNRSVAWAGWDEELLALELKDLGDLKFDLSLTGFNTNEIDALLAPMNDERANEVPPVPSVPVSQAGDLWLCGKHRVFCGNSTSKEAVACLLGDRQPILVVTDPPYGIELDSEWRDRAGLNGAPGEKRSPLSKALAKANPQYPAEASYMKHRTEGHNETSISGDTRADAPGTPQRLPRYGSGPPGTTATQRSTVRRERLSSKQYVKRVFQEKTKRCISSAARRPPAVGRNTGRRSRHGRYVASIANWPLDPHGSAPVAPKTHPWSIAPTASN
jgi:hypothetical protein